MGAIKPYGDWTNDGKVQLSFTLPMPAGERARQAAIALVQKMGFERVLVAHMKAMGSEFTFFVVYGITSHSIDPEEITVVERRFPVLAPKEINRLILEGLKRQLGVVGACTGTDAHTVGLDAILSMKGFAGDKGLEYYQEMRVFNLGSQVTPEEIAEVCRR
ncbi:MAG TPA: OAM dimerization domain-containing protein, partial [Actinomycetota bacterium]|nr:OAM dimerization domain-containing protein [Actinomycetota bacterium]